MVTIIGAGIYIYMREITKDQLEQIISSDDSVINNPSFQNEAGFFDFGIFTNYISQMKIENPSAYENWKFQEKSIIGVAKQRI